MAMKRGVLIITICYETPEGNFPRTKDHMPNRVLETLKKVQNTAKVIGVYDEHRRLSLTEQTEFSDISPELKALADAELGPEEVVA